MDPYYSGKLELSNYDLLRIRAKYGIRVWKRWDWYYRIKKLIARRKREFV
jgi:hypothetical protein